MLRRLILTLFLDHYRVNRPSGPNALKPLTNTNSRKNKKKLDKLELVVVIVNEFLDKYRGNRPFTITNSRKKYLKHKKNVKTELCSEDLY